MDGNAELAPGEATVTVFDIVERKKIIGLDTIALRNGGGGVAWKDGRSKVGSARGRLDRPWASTCRENYGSERDEDNPATRRTGGEERHLRYFRSHARLACQPQGPGMILDNR
jgi:hypothetical protein